MAKFRSQLSVSLPEGWLVAKDSFTLNSPDGRANVIVSSELLPSDIDARSYAQQQGELLRSEFPGYREIVFEPTEIFGGRSGYLRRFEWIPDQSQPVSQIQLYTTMNGRGYTATATTLLSEARRFELDLRLILGGLRLEL